MECNKKLENICKHFRNTSVVDTTKLGRAAHTSHGLHLNHTGKLKLATDLCNTFRNVKAPNKSVKTLPKPIALKWPDTPQLNSQDDGEGEENVSSSKKENNKIKENVCKELNLREDANCEGMYPEAYACDMSATRKSERVRKSKKIPDYFL